MQNQRLVSYDSSDSECQREDCKYERVLSSPPFLKEIQNNNEGNWPTFIYVESNSLFLTTSF